MWIAKADQDLSILNEISSRGLSHLCQRSILLFLVLNTFLVNLFCQEFQQSQTYAGIDHIFSHTTFLGGGAAFFDYDNDGDDDLYITSGEEMDHFYRNNGDGTFEDVSFISGFLNTKIYYTMGVVAGDIDNDGFQDLFVTTEYSDFDSPSKNLLFKNNGDGTFIDIWTHDNEAANKLSITAIMLDVNLDGFLDIYVINYVEDTSFPTGPDGSIVGFAHECYTNNLYINNGDGTFDDKSYSYRVSDTGCALAAVASDFNNDGLADIYIANDFGEFIEPNKLLLNNGPGEQFTEIGSEINLDQALYGMGIASGDIDHDLDIDYYVTNYGRNRLLLNEDNSFIEVGEDFHVDDTYFKDDSLLAIGWGAEFLDIDNDTDLDLFVGNGYVPGPSFIPSGIFIEDKLFRNEDGLDFIDITEEAGINNPFTTRGVTYSDYDNDGDLDLFSIVLNVPINGTGWQTILFENVDTSGNNWIQFDLEGTQVNRDAYGSRAYLYSGGQIFVQELLAGGSHSSMHTNTLHFGLDTLSSVDSLEVIWTGGMNKDVYYDLDINKRHLIKETEVEVVSKIAEDFSFKITISPNPTKDFVYLDLGHNYNNTIQVFNQAGQLVLQREESNQFIKIDLSPFSRGVYTLRIRNSSGFLTERIAKL